MHIPLSKPFWGSEEIRASTKAIKTTLGTGDGPSTKLLVGQLQTLLDVRRVLPVTSCTHGLELILHNLGVGKGDEVIVPSFTMSSTANAIVLAGGMPVFADIEDERYTIDPEEIKRCITPCTKGIILVHYAGMPCLIEQIQAIARKHHLFIVEDAAHAIGAFYKGKALGTFGQAGAFSFHGTKNVCCGEGGAVVTDDEYLADSMEIYRANGTNRRDFIKGKVDRYTWVHKGSSYFLSDILASILTQQLKKLSLINRKRAQIAKQYTRVFAHYQDIIVLPTVPAHTDPNWHIYALRFKKEAHADRFITLMNKKGIAVSTHYVPLHTSPMGIQLQKDRPFEASFLPVTQRVAKTLVRLPIYPGLTGKELHYIIEEAKRIMEQLGTRANHLHL